MLSLTLSANLLAYKITTPGTSGKQQAFAEDGIVHRSTAYLVMVRKHSSQQSVFLTSHNALSAATTVLRRQHSYKLTTGCSIARTSVNTSVRSCQTG